MKRKTLAILYYEINFINCLNFAKKLKNKYEIIFISSAFFDSLTDLDNNKKKLDKLNIKNYSFQEELLKFHNNIENNSKINFGYIKSFENRFLNKRKIEDLINCDYFMSEKNNPREDVLFHKDKKKKFLLAEYILKKIEKIMDENKIDIFFSMFPANFINNCFFEITQKKRKKFISTFTNRDGSLTLTDNFGFDFPKYIKKQVNKKLTLNEIHIKKYLEKNVLLNTENFSNKKNFLLGLKRDSSRLLKHFFSFKIFLEREINYFKSKKILGCDTRHYYQKNHISLFFVHLRYILRSLYLHYYIYKNSLNFSEIKKKYIYVPLHYYPEAYIYNQKNFDEIKMLKQIRKKIPKKIFLVIKPHPLFFNSGYEQHKISYFKQILKNENTILTSPYTNNLQLINNAITTVSYVGTSSLQSVLLGIPSYIFGNSELNFFNDIKNFVNLKLNKIVKKKTLSNKSNFKIIHYLKKNSIFCNLRFKRTDLIKLEKQFNLILK